MALKIVIADDAAFIREALIQICHSAGHIIVGEAVNGLMAVEKASSLKPDIIFMDLVMPEKNGIEATREILEILPNIKIIAISSAGEKFMLEKASAAGCFKFIAKPFTKKEIVDVLKMASIPIAKLGGHHG